jgi:ribosome assembly protein YihI (activator of Der GTPase)
MAILLTTKYERAIPSTRIPTSAPWRGNSGMPPPLWLEDELVEVLENDVELLELLELLEDDVELLPVDELVWVDELDTVVVVDGM